ncbi:hypothetical protein XI05_22785 [Bradyrhizobium sp. CCBAU 11357]|nr:hypothetical protein [Bradyrhizobium sp. CCBAU 11357]
MELRPKEGEVSKRRSLAMAETFGPAIHALPRGTKNVDAWAFASPKRLRPRRRDKPGYDDLPR